MPKFKKGDYVILREDARYPTDNSLWSTIDKSLICGDLFKVEMLGSYTWLGKQGCIDCISVLDGAGWMPESCFDLVQITKFQEGDWVECYRLPNKNDWTITNCGEIIHSLKVGEKYEVKKLGNKSNIIIVINGEELKGYYPPTIFRKTTSPTQELPEEWCVACEHRDKDTPELLEWRNNSWTGEGYIYSSKFWFPEPCDNIISYETFLEKVYKPWKALRSTLSSSYITNLPDKWVYSLENESPDRLKLIQEWRLSVCKMYSDYPLYNNFSICNHEDGSYYYTNSPANYINSFKEDAIEINKEMFDKFILQPWIDKNKHNSKIPQQEISKSLDSEIYDLYTYTGESIILSDTHAIDKTPHLIVNKSKKRLFSTEVQELNVNLKLLKTQ